MCGIVLAGGALTVSEVGIFNDLLYMDVIRGVHATGVYAKHLHGKVNYYKDATPSSAFLASEGYKDLLRNGTTYTSPPVFMVGHNRHATRGNSSDPKNAHPFQHGNITLVHNGTLDDQDLLPESNRFVVDSENICYSIDKIGAAETIQKLDGAFTLIWHDANDDTLHIIRNSERPFHLARCGSDWFGASEEDMLMWILKRTKLTKNRIAEHFECEVGTEYIFDVSGPSKKMVLKEQVKHVLPVFTATNWASRYNAGYRTTTQSSAYNPSGSRDSARRIERERQNAIALEEGISPRMDQRIAMLPHSFFAYPSTADRGRITGYIYEEEKARYYEVDVHNVERAMYETCMDSTGCKITGIVVGIHKVKDTVRLIINNPSVLTPNTTTNTQLAVIDQELTELNDDIPFGEPDSITMPNGLKMTKATWNRHDHNKCGGCNQEIPWKEAGGAVMALNCYWHPSCYSEYLQLVEEESDLFQCAVCGKDVVMSEMHSEISSVRGEDICNHCAEEIIAKRSETKEVRFIDTAKPESGVLTGTFTEKVFNGMIKMKGSDNATFADLDKCKLERRTLGVFAYYFKKGENNAHQGETFPKGTGVQSIAKSLKNGSGEIHITKAYWNQIGVCENCYTTIPWKDVERCALSEKNRIVCPICKGE